MAQGSTTVAGYRARVASTRQTATVSAGPVGQAWYRRGGPLLAIGAAAFAVSLAGYIIYALTNPSSQWMQPVDLQVYTDGGLIVRHVAPFYRAYRAAPLYDWPGYLHLPFTYAPFAAMVFAPLSLVSFATLMNISVGVNIAAVLATIWMTFGGLGFRRGLVRLGATLLLAAPLLWTEPVQRTLFLGQIELVLMALIIWDHVPAGPALVEGGGHRRRGRHQADSADLHPVPAADPQVPAGRRRGGNVRGDLPARVRRAARRFQEVLADRAVRAGQPHRVRRLGGQPVAAGARSPG